MLAEGAFVVDVAASSVDCVAVGSFGCVAVCSAEDCVV